MVPGRKTEFAEVLVHKLYLELFSAASGYRSAASGAATPGISFEEFRSKLKGLMRSELSTRQKQVLEYSLRGKSEREIAHALGITQQVVNIHKGRARRKLRQWCLP
ncbi:MAG: hypothetical protein JSV52_01770 [Candidatus Zixiibacteriota bacterium]|nr:MAG: hypothetical protein JSV52_01770 [candidate division Zixibacteria bacterium]